MGKFLTATAIAVIIYFIFTTFPFMLPTMSRALYLPYELWFLALLIFYVFLPKDVGTFIYTLREENK